MSYPSLDSSKFPKIQYLTTSGVYAELLFSEQIEDPNYNYEPLVVDNTAVSGSRQTAYFRTDEFFELTMKWITSGDLEHWKSFFRHARTGLPFRYYADKSQSSFVTFSLEEKVFAPTLQGIPNFYTFKLKFRRELF